MLCEYNRNRVLIIFDFDTRVEVFETILKSHDLLNNEVTETNEGFDEFCSMIFSWWLMEEWNSYETDVKFIGLPNDKVLQIAIFSDEAHVFPADKKILTSEEFLKDLGIYGEDISNSTLLNSLKINLSVHNTELMEDFGFGDLMIDKEENSDQEVISKINEEIIDKIERSKDLGWIYGGKPYLYDVEYELIRKFINKIENELSPDNLEECSLNVIIGIYLDVITQDSEIAMNQRANNEEDKDIEVDVFAKRDSETNILVETTSSVEHQKSHQRKKIVPWIRLSEHYESEMKAIYVAPQFSESSSRFTHFMENFSTIHLEKNGLTDYQEDTSLLKLDKNDFEEIYKDFKEDLSDSV